MPVARTDRCLPAKLEIPFKALSKPSLSLLSLSSTDPLAIMPSLMDKIFLSSFLFPWARLVTDNRAAFLTSHLVAYSVHSLVLWFARSIILLTHSLRSFLHEMVKFLVMTACPRRQHLGYQNFSKKKKEVKINKAGYTAIQSHSWAGAVMRKPHGIQKCDGRTDIPTDTARCRVACPRLKRV